MHRAPILLGLFCFTICLLYPHKISPFLSLFLSLFLSTSFFVSLFIYLSLFLPLSLSLSFSLTLFFFPLSLCLSIYYTIIFSLLLCKFVSVKPTRIFLISWLNECKHCKKLKCPLQLILDKLI